MASASAQHARTLFPLRTSHSGMEPPTGVEEERLRSMKGKGRLVTAKAMTHPADVPQPSDAQLSRHAAHMFSSLLRQGVPALKVSLASSQALRT